MLTYKTLQNLLNIDTIKRASQAIAMLDAIIMPEWQFRYYSFDYNWSKYEELASMRNSSGDHYFILFNMYGAIIKGYSSESKFGSYFIRENDTVHKIIEDIPIEFQSFFAEPAVSPEETTFCIWRKKSDKSWNCNNIEFLEYDSDGSDDLLFIFDNNPETYKEWAEEYYEKEINLNCVEHIYQHKILTEKIVQTLNPSNNLQNLSDDITSIGYPV